MSHAIATADIRAVRDRPPRDGTVNAPRRTASQVLADAHTVAVVGASTDPAQPANWIPKMLREQGWHVIAVNPRADELFGHPAYARLADIPDGVDLVVVFDTSCDLMEIAHQTVRVGAGALWLQPGLRSGEARRIAYAAGIDYVEDTCVGTERAIAGMVRSGYRPKNVTYRGNPPRRVPLVVSARMTPA
jgi:uncharacterized protein